MVSTHLSFQSFSILALNSLKISDEVYDSFREAVLEGGGDWGFLNQFTSSINLLVVINLLVEYKHTLL